MSLERHKPSRNRPPRVEGLVADLKRGRGDHEAIHALLSAAGKKGAETLRKKREAEKAVQAAEEERKRTEEEGQAAADAQAIESQIREDLLAAQRLNRVNEEGDIIPS